MTGILDYLGVLALLNYCVLTVYLDTCTNQISTLIISILQERYRERSGKGELSNHDGQHCSNSAMLPSAPPHPINMGDLPPAYEDIAPSPHQNMFLIEQQDSGADSRFLVVCTWLFVKLSQWLFHILVSWTFTLTNCSFIWKYLTKN